MDEMRDVASEVKELGRPGAQAQRAGAGASVRTRTIDAGAAEARLATLLGAAA